MKAGEHPVRIALAGLLSCSFVFACRATASASLTVAPEERVLVDTSRSTPADGSYPGAPDRTLRTLLWYPSGACGGGDPCPPYPLLLMAHGFGGLPDDFDAFATTMAALGYVVAAPAFPLTNGNAPGGGTGLVDVGEQPGDLAFVAGEMIAASAAAADPLFGLVDAGAIAALGHSLGGATVRSLAHSSCCMLLDLDAAILVSAPALNLIGGAYVDTGPPTLVIQGTADTTVPFANASVIFDTLPAPRILVGLDGANHGEMMTSQVEPPVPARAAAQLAVGSFLDSRFRGDDADLDSALVTLDGEGDIVVREQCLAQSGTCDDACTAVAWNDPPASPPDQNPEHSVVRLAGLHHAAGRQTIVSKGRFNSASAMAAVDPATDGVHVRIEDGSAVLYDVNVPGGAIGSAACDARDGWRTITRNSGAQLWLYHNRSGALPPLCLPGSARGVSTIRIDDGRSGRKAALAYVVKAKHASLFAPPAEPITYLRADLSLAAESVLGVATTQSLAGQCAQAVFSGSPVASSPPRPFCRVASAGAIAKTVVCRGP